MTFFSRQPLGQPVIPFISSFKARFSENLTCFLALRRLMMSLIKGLPICQRDTAKAACWDEFRIHSFVTSLVAFILPSVIPSFLFSLRLRLLLMQMLRSSLQITQSCQKVLPDSDFSCIGMKMEINVPPQLNPS